MKLKPEQIEQIKLFDWIKSIPKLRRFCFHIANERKTSPQEGLILQRMGVRSGVSDIFIGVSRGTYHGFFLELKAGNNLPTKNQLDFMEDMSSQNYYCTWCKGYEKARETIEWYMELSQPTY